MGFIYVVIGILIIAFFVEYPIIAILITIGLIALITYFWKKTDNDDLEKNQTDISYAVKIIEEAYTIAQQGRKYEPFMITMYEENFSTGARGFSIILATHTESWARSVIEEFAANYPSWNVNINAEHDFVYLERNYYGKVVGVWSLFNNEVWDKIKNLHPSWNIEKIRNDKSVVHIR